MHDHGQPPYPVTRHSSESFAALDRSTSVSSAIAARQAADRRLVEQAASLAVGLVVASIRDGSAKSAAKGTREGQISAAVAGPYADVIEGRSGQIVDAVTKAILSQRG